MTRDRAQIGAAELMKATLAYAVARILDALSVRMDRISAAAKKKAGILFNTAGLKRDASSD